MRARVLMFSTAAAMLLIGCSASHDAARVATDSDSPSTTSVATSGPQLPSAVLRWVRDYNARSTPGTSADWVLTTRGKAALGVGSDYQAPVYLFDVHGTFVWQHSCPPQAPPSACTSKGNHEVFTLDPRRLQVLDYSVEPGAPNLAQLGAVGHITF